MGGSSPGTTSVHTLATPPTTSRLSIHPHLGRKSPSARAQIPNVVASSFVEMAPAAFACSATSCERARLSPRSRCPSAHLVARGRLHPAPLCLPVSAPTSRSPDFLGGQSSQLRTPTPPPHHPPLSWELWPRAPSLAMRPEDLRPRPTWGLRLPSDGERRL